MTGDFVSPIHERNGKLASFINSLRNARADRPVHFVLTLGSTQTSDVSGISAAGATAEMRRFTPSIDAEALVLGRTVTGKTIPASPAGVVSPVVLTRGALRFVKKEVHVVNAGAFHPPALPHIGLGTAAARCLSTGTAQELFEVERLYARGLEIGHKLSLQCSYVILSECVPGGTTTALGLLSGLGYEAHGLCSSSMPQADQSLRRTLVLQGLRKADLIGVKNNPLKAVAAMGDPMQPVVAGITVAASEHVPVLLAGGTQMLAVWALAKAMAEASGKELDASRVAVITTKWVAYDINAGARLLAEMVDAPFAAACPNFRRSRHPGLRAYEDGHVKEGAGAGGSMAAAHLTAGASEAEIVEAVDKTYDELVLGI